MGKHICLFLLIIGGFLPLQSLAASASIAPTDSTAYVLKITKIKNGKTLYATVGEQIKFKLKGDRRIYKGVIQSMSKVSIKVNNIDIFLHQIDKIKPTYDPKTIGLKILGGLLTGVILFFGFYLVLFSGFYSTNPGQSSFFFLLLSSGLLLGSLAPFYGTGMRKIGEKWKLELVKREELNQQ